MKIGDIKDSATQLIQQYQNNANTNRPVDVKKAGVALVAEETVNLSAKSKEMQLAKNAISALPDVREETVQELQAQIEKGTYKINSAAIAEKMINESIVDLFI